MTDPTQAEIEVALKRAEQDGCNGIGCGTTAHVLAFVVRSQRAALEKAREALRLNLESNVSNLYVLGTVKDGLKQYVVGPDWDLVIASIQEERDRANEALGEKA